MARIASIAGPAVTLGPCSGRATGRRRIQSDPVALIAAARAGEDTALDGVEIDVLTVGGLDPAAARALLSERWGERLAPTVREAPVRATGGNPLALVELPAGLTPGRLAAREAPS